MANVQANGMTIEYDVRGAGEPLLMVMGLGGQLIDWPDEFADLFVARGFQVVRFDNRDSGLSSKTDWTPPSQAKMMRSFLTRRPLADVGYTVADMADDAAALLDALGLSQAHVVGMSMGGMIAQELAIRHPEKVLSMCSIMSNTGDGKNGGISLGLMRKLATRKPPTRASAVDDTVALMQAISGTHFDAADSHERAATAIERCFTPDGVARQTAAIAGSRDRTALLAGVKARTLVIHGLADPLVKRSGGEATARAIPNARLLAFGDMAHDLPLPRWQEICDAIVRNARSSQASQTLAHQSA